MFIEHDFIRYKFNFIYINYILLFIIQNKLQNEHLAPSPYVFFVFVLLYF